MGGQTNARRVTQWFFISIKATKKKHQMHIYVWQTWFLFRKRRKDQISNPFSFIQTHSWNKVWEKIKTDLRWTVYYKKKPISYKTLHFILIHYGFWIALTIKKKMCDQLYHANQNVKHKTLRNVAIFEGSNFFSLPHKKLFSPFSISLQIFSSRDFLIMNIQIFSHKLAFYVDNQMWSTHVISQLSGVFWK